MGNTDIKDNDTLRVRNASAPIPEGTRIALVPSPPHAAPAEGATERTLEESEFDQAALHEWASSPADAGVDWNRFFSPNPSVS